MINYALIFRTVISNLVKYLFLMSLHYQTPDKPGEKVSLSWQNLMPWGSMTFKCWSYFDTKAMWHFRHLLLCLSCWISTCTLQAWASCHGTFFHIKGTCWQNFKFSLQSPEHLGKQTKPHKILLTKRIRSCQGLKTSLDDHLQVSCWKIQISKYLHHQNFPFKTHKSSLLYSCLNENTRFFPTEGLS